MTLRTDRDRGPVLASADADALLDAMLTLAASLPGPELVAMIGRFANTARRLCPDGQFPTDAKELQLFRTALRFLGRVAGHARMTANGLLYRGRPDFVTPELLEALRAEARDVVRPRAIWQRGHLLGVGSPLGDRFATSPELRELVESLAGPVDATGVASFLFYEQAGAGIAAHVDTDVFSINVNLVLRREDAGIRSSRFFLFHVDGLARQDMLLEEGELVVTFGDSVLHGRSPLADGEVITNLTVGFQPANWVD